MSDSSRGQLYISDKEVTWGTTPGGNFDELRFTGESLKVNTQTTRSNEVRSDRQVADNVRSGQSAGGGTNHELSYQSIDKPLEGVLSSEFPTNYDITSSSLTFTAANRRITGADFSSFVPGQWIHVTDTVSNDGYYKVAAANATQLDIVAAQSFTDEGPVSCNVYGTFIKNGTTFLSYTLEKLFSDVTKYQTFRGMVPNSMNLNVQQEQVTVDFDWLGQDGIAADVSAGAGVDAAPTSKVFTGVDNLAGIYLGAYGSVSSLNISGITLNVAGAARLQPALANLNPIGIGQGRFSIGGTFEAYFVDNTEYSDYLAFTEKALAFRLIDSNDNGYYFDVPRLNLTDFTAPIPGNDQDVFANLTFEASRESTDDLMIGVTRFAG